jgi:hypothetical protein
MVMVIKGYDEWKLDSGYEDGDAPEPVPPKPVKIVTHYDPKPIPVRIFDWSAVTDNYAGQIDDPVTYRATRSRRD